MPVINSQPIGNSYPAAAGTGNAALSNVWNSRGGWFSVTGAGAYVQLQYGDRGSDRWVEEILLGAGAFVVVPPNCRGMQFRNSVANAIATVTAQIAQGDEPPLAISSIGQTNVVSVASLNFQHNELAVATEPTLDFVDTANVLKFVTTDDPPGTRLKLGVSWPTSPVRFPAATYTVESLHGNGIQIGGDGVNPSWSLTDANGHEAHVSIVPDAVSGFACFLTGVVGDAVDWRWYVDGAGQVSWGPGSAARDVFMLRAAVGVLRIQPALSVGPAGVLTNGSGTLTVQGRLFSGAASTGGIWVDGGTNQFVGSNSATLMGLFNNGWKLLLDNAGVMTLQGTYGFATGVAVGGTATVAGVALTLNKISGLVSFTGQSNTASVPKAFTVTCNQCAASDVVMVSMNNTTTAGGSFVVSAVPAAGGFTIVCFSNTGNAAVTYAFNYWIFKAANS